MSDPTSPPLSPTAEPAKPEVYRPLSLLALLGFGLAALYTAIVLVRAVAAFFAGDPLLMSGLWLIVPVGAVVLSGMGWAQINRSEGTLAGEKLARWGVLLSLLVGLGYWSYVGATYFVIERQADEVGRDFVQKLTRRDMLSAFLMTLPPSERPAEGAEARGQVEARFNAGQMSRTGGGALTAFAQTPYVRLLSLGGDETKVESSGVDKWGYINGGYQVRLLYNVETPQISFVMEVSVQAKEGKGSERRQWYVLWDQIGLRGDLDKSISPRGKNQLPVAMQGRDFLGGPWVRFIDGGRTLDVYLATLPEGERDGARQRAEQGLLGMVLADGLGAGVLPGGAAVGAARVALAADADRARAAWLPGLHDFLAGDLVHADADLFWAPPESRQEIIDAFRQAFRHPDAQLATMVMPDVKIRFPWMHVKGDRFVVECDFTARVPYAMPRFLVEGLLVVDCDAAQAEAGNVSSWRVLRVDLISAKAAPTRGGGAAEGGAPQPPMPVQ